MVEMAGLSVAGRGRQRMLAFAASGVLALAVALVVGVLLGRASPQYPDGDDADVGFVRAMMVHHDQAVQMADIVRSRTADPDLRLLATDISLTQQGQIGQMRGWLELWGVRPVGGGDDPMAWMGMAGPMPGMATRPQVSALATDTLPEAERDFLTLMIAHHEAGVHMAIGALERCDEKVVVRMATNMMAAQQSEIDVMRDLLAAR